MAAWASEFQFEPRTKYDTLNEEQLARLADLYSRHGMFDKAAEARELIISKEYDRKDPNGIQPT